MPGQPLQATAFVLGRQPSGADGFEQVPLFNAEHGLLFALRRVSGKAAAQASPLDLFDEAEFRLESSSQGRTWFIREHRPLTRHPGIGRSYDALRAAGALATLVTRNPVPDESRDSITALLRQAFSALDGGARPDLVWFKALFCFLRDEGHPVKQQWWQDLHEHDRDAAAAILNRPIGGQNPEPAIVVRLSRLLADWTSGHTEIRLQ